MLFSKCLRAKIYCNMNGHFDPQGCQTLLLKESELFFYLWAPGLQNIILVTSMERQSENKLHTHTKTGHVLSLLLRGF